MSKTKYVKKLGTDSTYKKPKVTYQQNLSADEIAEKLMGYEKVDNIAEVPINTHMRYFAKQEDGTQVFRTGGILVNKQNADTYVRLSNGANSWSVQVKDAIFFKKLSHKDEIENIKAVYEKKLEEKEEIINKLKEYIRQKNKIDDTDIKNIILNRSNSYHKSKANQINPNTEIKLAKSTNSTNLTKTTKSNNSTKSTNTKTSVKKPIQRSNTKYSSKTSKK